MSVTFFGVIRIVAKRRIAIFGLYFKVLKKVVRKRYFTEEKMKFPLRISSVNINI